MPKNDRDINVETNTHRDGLKEGVMSDTKGVQIGIETNTNIQMIDPKDVASLTNKSVREVGKDSGKS